MLVANFPAAPSILVYGRDASLLQIRRLVLERTGVDVWTSLECRETERVIATQQIQLLILCHTLSADECACALSIALSLRPTMKRLLLAGADWPMAGEYDSVLSVFDGPKALIARTQTLLNETGDRDGVMLGRGRDAMVARAAIYSL